MEEAIFADGLPRRITPADIKRWHLVSFPRLAEDENLHIIEEAIDAVYTMFYGSQDLFDRQPRQIWYDKTQLLFRFLVCWYIADQYPLFVAGTPVMGGIPLKSKKIGSITLSYQDNAGQNKDYQDLLSGLKSNSWGNKAYSMIRGAAKRISIGGNRQV